MIRILWPFTLGAFALGLDAYVLAGLLPAMAHDLHVPQASVGLGIAIFTAAYAVSAPTLSPLAARRSTRLGLLTGLVLFTLGNILTITSSSLPLLLLSRAVAGLGAGIFSPLASSTAANMVDASQKGRALSTVLGGLGSGTAFGVPVGLAIERWFGWRWTIGLLVLLGLIAAAGVALYRAELPKVRTDDLKARLSALRAPFTLATLSVTFFTSFSVLGLYTYIAEVMMSRGMNDCVGMLIWLRGVGGMIGSLGIGKVIDHHLPPSRVTPILLCTIVISYLLVGYVGVAGAAMGCFVWGLAGWATLAPQQHALMSNDSANSVAALAWNSSINYLGGAIGAAVGSVLLSAYLAPTSLPLFAMVGVAVAIGIHSVKMRIPVGTAP